MSSPLQDSRLKKGQGKIRESRALQSRSVTANRDLTDSERRDAFKRSFFQSHLPDLPKIDGFHVCWLTTANVQDPIHARLRFGYELLEAAEYPGWEHAKSKASSDYPGKIMVNEMIAAKIRLDLYQDFMAWVHHQQPLEQAAAIKNRVQAIVDGLSQSGARGVGAEMTGGMKEMGQDPGVPDFGRLNGESADPYEPHEMEHTAYRRNRHNADEEIDEDEGRTL